MNLLRKIKKFLLNSFCLSCRSIETEPFFHFCEQCIKKFTLMKQLKHICPYCHDSWISNDTCQNCFNQKPVWDKIHTIYPYKDSLKHLFHLYKFRNSVLAEQDLVRLLKPHLEKFVDYHWIVISCSNKTKKRLGFNPVTQIIKQIKTNYYEPFINKTSINMKNLTRVSRKSILDTMELENISISANKKILVIDDVFTTGTTLTQAVNLLKTRYQDHNIEILCFFRS